MKETSKTLFITIWRKWWQHKNKLEKQHFHRNLTGCRVGIHTQDELNWNDVALLYFTSQHITCLVSCIVCVTTLQNDALDRRWWWFHIHSFIHSSFLFVFENFLRSFFLHFIVRVQNVSHEFAIFFLSLSFTSKIHLFPSQLYVRNWEMYDT